jgi:hypothetical protein
MNAYRGRRILSPPPLLTSARQGEEWSNLDLSNSRANLWHLFFKKSEIMVGEKPRNSCTNLFKRLKILPFPYKHEHIFSLIKFSANNQEKFQKNSTVHSINTRNANHLLRQIARLSCSQKRMHYAGINIPTVYRVDSEVL